MPPRYTYWTIIFGGQATAFRSASRDELLPTFKQIQSKHADAQLRYFARGKLWYSEEEAQAALVRERLEKRRPQGERRREGPRPFGDRAFRDRPQGDRPPRDDRPRGDRPHGAGGWKPKTGSRPPAAAGWKRRPDDRNPRPDSRKPEAGSWKPKAGGRGPEAGGRKPGGRGPDWRPGGAHQDPRARFKVPRDVKRARMAKKFGWKKKDEDK